VKSINAFAVSAAVEKARTIIAQEERLRLSEEEASQLIFFTKYMALDRSCVTLINFL